MKVLSRNFTRMEKLLIFALILILLGLFYYHFIDRNVKSTIEAANAEYNEMSSQLDTLEAQVKNLTKVQDTMDEMEKQGNLSWMGSYNNSKEELRFLNDILASTLNYSISFSNVTRAGDQIRRSFSLTYRTPSYKAARDIMIQLLEGKNRCLISNVSCSIGRDGSVSMSESCTFYETMVGGTADAGLPANSAAANQ